MALAGGVGGAKLAHGLAMALPSADLTVVVNTGDDFTHLGLHICPDVDTVCYTLAGLANPVMGWGLAGESWNMLDSLKRLGGPSWFNMGDRDIATHLERTRRLELGEPLSGITRAFCRAWGVQPVVLPMSDDPVATWVQTVAGEELPFQEYFVHQGCEPQVTGFRFVGAEAARAAPGVVEAIHNADAIVICPSNPWVSIAPILSVAEIREEIWSRRKAGMKIVAVSPIIGGKALKGPAAKMFAELGIQPTALAVAEKYAGLLSGFVLDNVDADQAQAVRALGMAALATDSVMKSDDDRRRLAEITLAFLDVC